MIYNKTTLIVLFLTFSQLLFSQKNEQFDYIGNLAISDTILLTYRIKFNINKNKITGYSYTDIHGSDETKSKILGTYNKKDKKIVFKESEILYTKSRYIDGDFCFIDAIGEINFNKKKSSIKGKFNGKLINNDVCATGTFNLLSLKSIKRKVKKMERKVKKSIFIKKETKNEFAKEFNENIVLESFKPSILTANENLSIFCDKEQIKIEIWDNKKEDRDIVSITFNGKLILKEYEIKNKKKAIYLTLNQKINTLKFTANDQGLIGKNTVTINIIDSNNKITNVTTRLKLNESTSINLIKK